MSGYSRARLFKEVFEAAKRFDARRFWEVYPGDGCFAVDVPGEKHTMFANIMGQGGEQFGLTLFRGPEAFSDIRAMLRQTEWDEVMLDSCNILGFAMVRMGEIPPEERRFLNIARAPKDPSAIVPDVIAKDKGKVLHKLRRPEAETMLYALKGILRADAEGILRPELLSAGEEILTLYVSGDPMEPEVQAEFRSYEDDSSGKIIDFPMPDAKYRDLPEFDAHWLVDFRMLPVTISDENATIWCLAIMEIDTDELIVGEPLFGGDVTEATERILEAFDGENIPGKRGLPKAVNVTSRSLYESLSPALDALGVECYVWDDVDELDALYDAMLDFMEMVEMSDVDPDVMPEPDDLQGWKECDKILCREIGDIVSEDGGISSRALSRYFGDADFGRWALDSNEFSLLDIAVYEWVFTDYRPTYKSKTLAEKTLEEGVVSAHRALIESRMDGAVSIYRIEDIDSEEGFLYLEDVLFGGKWKAHDWGLSSTARVDLSLPARLYAAGDFHLIAPLGPPLSHLSVDRAVALLVKEGMELTRDGVKEDINLFGRLWEWQGNMPQRKLVNFDGDDIAFYTITYEITDEAAARSSISSRDDVDGEGDEMHWVGYARRKEQTVAPEEPIALGRLQFVADELLVELNSAERVDRIRSWLDQTPGLQFKHVAKKEIDEILEEGPPPDEMVGPAEDEELPPELIKAVAEEMRQYYMDWLDTAVPAFGGMSPREMCKEPGGKQRVGIMIRSMPEEIGSPPVPVPKAEMLRELGIDQ